jgi:hypothetical protein
MGAFSTLLHDAAPSDPQVHASDLAEYFQSNQKLLMDVVKQTADGDFWRGIVKDVLHRTAEKLRCPYRAVKAIVDLDIPSSRYERYIHQGAARPSQH